MPTTRARRGADAGASPTTEEDALGLGFKIPLAHDIERHSAPTAMCSAARESCGDRRASCGRSLAESARTLAYPEHKEWCWLTADTHQRLSTNTSRCGATARAFARSFGAHGCVDERTAVLPGGARNDQCGLRPHPVFWTSTALSRRAFDVTRAAVAERRCTYVPRALPWRSTERECRETNATQTDAAGPGLLKAGMDSLDMVGEELLRRPTQTSGSPIDACLWARRRISVASMRCSSSRT